jgi:membrane protease YdiL (CAAX protease family)
MTLSYEGLTPPVSSRRNPVSQIICWMVIAAFVAFTGWSNWKHARRDAISAASSTTSPNFQLAVTSRASLGEMELLAKNPASAGKTDTDRLAKQLHASIAELAVSPLDKLEAVVMTRELLGSDAALRELDDPSATFASNPALQPDAQSLRQILIAGPQSIDAGARSSLVKHLDWFGQLALTQGGPADSTDRLKILQSAKNCMYRLIGMLAGLIGAAVFGFLLLVVLIILFGVGTIRFKFSQCLREGIDAPVFLETFALWCVMWFILSLVLSRWKAGRSLLLPELLMLAATMLVALWPLCRGVRWGQLRQSLGWHRGAGVLTEMGFGAIGYLAGLPIIALGFCATFLLIKLAHANPSHPIQSEFSAAMPVAKILSLLLAASLAAPILEETMFRGALYFHLRRRWQVPLSATLVAFIFAAIHPQGWTVIPALGSIAIVLALMREWRGSLLASVTAHGINNAIVLVFGILVLR